MSTNIYAHNVVNHDHHKEFSFTVNSTDDALRLSSALLEQGNIEDVTPDDIPLFKYIHPSIISESEKRQIHGEIQNIVRSLPLREVCRYLRQMYKDKRVYLNVKIDAMFDELHRLGLPDENTPGYSFKNFQNYFNVD